MKTHAVRTRRQKLLRRILDDALHVYRRYAIERTPGGRHLFEETAAWFASDDRRWSSSFRVVCDELQLDADAIRARVARWAAEGRQIPLLDASNAHGL